MSISDFLGLCHHNEPEEGADLATASSSHPLPPFPITRLCNFLCDFYLQQKSLGDLCHHPHESWGNKALPKRGRSGFSSMQQAGQPTHRPAGICGAKELCPGNCNLPAATQTGAGLARDFDCPPFARLTGFSVLLLGVFVPLTAYLSISKWGTEERACLSQQSSPMNLVFYVQGGNRKLKSPS